jgi:hypothetical protein
LHQRFRKESVGIGKKFVKNRYLKMFSEITAQTYRLHTPQKKVDLPILFRTAIEYCLSGQEFTVTMIPGLSPEEQKIMLDRLLAEGVVIASDINE